MNSVQDLHPPHPTDVGVSTGLLLIRKLDSLLNKTFTRKFGVISWPTDLQVRTYLSPKRMTVMKTMTTGGRESERG